MGSKVGIGDVLAPSIVSRVPEGETVLAEADLQSTSKDSHGTDNMGSSLR